MTKLVEKCYNNLLLHLFILVSYWSKNMRKCLMNKGLRFIILIVLFVLLDISPSYAQASGGLFSELIAKGVEIFNGMRDIIYIVSGLGIIAVAIGGFFGNLNWKWLSAIIIGLMVIGMTGGIITFLTGQSPEGITDTLK